MKEVSKKSDRKILPDTPNAISSQGSQDGPWRCDSQASRIPAQSGQDHHPARASASQGNSLGFLMNDIWHRSSLPLSASVSRQSSLVSKLARRLPLAGGTLYKHTWKKKTTPVGWPYCQLLGSGHRTSAKGCSSAQTGWLSPTTTMINERSPQAMEKRAAQRAATGRTSLSPGNLAEQVTLMLAAWPTPTANDFKGSGPTVMRKDGKDRTFDRLDYATEQGLDTGAMPNGSNAVTANTGQLNPSLARWLMGFPAAWDFCSPNYQEWLTAIAMADLKATETP